MFQVEFTTAVDDAVYRRPCMYDEGPVPLAFRSGGQVSLLSLYTKTTCSVGESTEVMKVRIFASKCFFKKELPSPLAVK